MPPSSAPTTSSGTPPDLVVAEINRRILESGELSKHVPFPYASYRTRLMRSRLESHLLQLLQEAGWTEQLRMKCEERLRDPEAAVGSYDELRDAVEEDAVKMVPDHVKVEMLKKLLVVLRGMVEE